VHPTIDKAAPEVEAGDGQVALHKVADTEQGIVVRGARVLATLAPVSEELVVDTGQPIPKVSAGHRASFAVPTGPPGRRKVPRRRNEGATRQTIGPGSARGCPS